MDAIATVAQIRADHTWTEMKVETGGGNWQNCADNAIEAARMELNWNFAGGYPENIIGLTVIKMEPRHVNIHKSTKGSM